MAIDFPASPTEDQLFTPAGSPLTYIYKAPRWLLKASGTTDAPSDGKTYVRQNGAWVAVKIATTMDEIGAAP